MRSERWIIPKQILEGILIKYQGTADIPPKEYDFWDTISTFFTEDVRPGDPLKWDRYKFPESRTLKRAIEQNKTDQYAGVNIEKKRGYPKSDGELLLDILCLYAFGIDWDATLNDLNIPTDAIYKHKKGIKIEAFVQTSIVLEDNIDEGITEEEAQAKNEITDIIEEIDSLVRAKRFVNARKLIDSVRQDFTFSEFEEKIIIGFEASILTYHLKKHGEAQKILWNCIEYFTAKNINQNVIYFSLTLADALRETGDYNEADILLKKCVKFFKDTKIEGFKSQLALTYLKLAESKMQQGKMSKSTLFLDKVDRIIATRLVDNNGFKDNTYLSLSAYVQLFRGRQAFYSSQHFQESIRLVENAITILKKIEDAVGVASSTEILVTLCVVSKIPSQLQMGELISEVVKTFEEYEVYPNMAICLLYLFTRDPSAKVNGKTFEDYFEFGNLLEKCSNDARVFYIYAGLKHDTHIKNRDYEGAKQAALDLIMNGRTKNIIEDIIEGYMLYLNVFWVKDEIDKKHSEIDTAIDELKKALDKGVNQYFTMKIHHGIARLYRYKKDYSLAIKHFEIALSASFRFFRENDRLEIQYMIADCYLDKQDYDKAKLLFDEILQNANYSDYPGSIDYIFKAKLNIGRCHYYLNEDDKAREFFLDALEFNRIHGLNNDESVTYFLNRL